MSLDDVLEQSRVLLDPALRKAVESLSEPERLVASYHLGFVDGQGNPTSGERGKRLRPTLTLLGAQAARIDPATVVAAAVAVELTHNFSLVHDDIMDRDTTRRHRLTVWALWGEATAILAGDALQTLAFEALVEHGTAASARAAQFLATTTRELIRGQALDMRFEAREQQVRFAQCLDMAGAKTGSLLACSAAIGAVLGGADDRVIAALSSYGEHVGLAFQIVDDLLGTWGDPVQTGKSIYSDLRAKKCTLPLTWALERAGSEQIRDWLLDGPVDNATLDAIAGQLEGIGAREWCHEAAREQVSAGEQVLSNTGLQDEACADLIELARFVVRREV